MDRNNNNNEAANDVVADQIPHSFLCCVCLDLLYKPIVLPCGHVSCFWCVHLSMNGREDSRCPICRSSYHHFPSICKLFHFLIVKMFPADHKRREDQILVYEKQRDCFSPQFNYSPCVSCANREHDHLRDAKYSRAPSLKYSSYLELCVRTKASEQRELVSHVQDGDMSISEQISDEDCKVCKGISAADVVCVACKQLLFRPVVLTCGHVYCETCISCTVDEMLRCQVCQILHPGSFPKVCLEFDHFLEEKFPKDYALRRDAVQLKPVHIKSATTCSAGTSEKGPPIEKKLPLRATAQSSTVHTRVGCDSCGVYPIIGERYRCKDCVEKIGFDLCGDCYNTHSKVPGRFNQQHTPEHKFELVKRYGSIRPLLLRPASEQLENVPTTFASYVEISDVDDYYYHYMVSSLTGLENAVDENEMESTG